MFTPLLPSEGHRRLVYKFLTPDNSGEPGFGACPWIRITKEGLLRVDLIDNYSAEGLRQRYYYQSAIGGTPTEIAAATYDGYVVLKQPFAKAGGVTRPDILTALKEAGAVPVPRHLVSGAKDLAIVTVDSVPLLISDLHDGNIVFDGQGNPRLNDVIISKLPPETLTAMPELADVVKRALALEVQNPRRSHRPFVAVKMPPKTPLPNDPAVTTRRMAPDATKPADPGTTKRFDQGSTKRIDTGSTKPVIR